MPAQAADIPSRPRLLTGPRGQARPLRCCCKRDSPAAAKSKACDTPAAPQNLPGANCALADFDKSHSAAAPARPASPIVGLRILLCSSTPGPLGGQSNFRNFQESPSASGFSQCSLASLLHAAIRSAGNGMRAEIPFQRPACHPAASSPDLLPDLRLVKNPLRGLGTSDAPCRLVPGFN